jgi:hypothetical protein
LHIFSEIFHENFIHAINILIFLAVAVEELNQTTEDEILNTGDKTNEKTVLKDEFSDFPHDLKLENHAVNLEKDDDRSSEIKDTTRNTILTEGDGNLFKTTTKPEMPSYDIKFSFEETK